MRSARADFDGLMAAIGWKADDQEWLIEADRKLEPTSETVGDCSETTE